MIKLVKAILITAVALQAAPTNYCSINLIDFISDKKEFTEFSNIKRKNQLDFQKSGSVESHKILRVAEKINFEKPYEKKLAIEFLKLTDPYLENYKDNQSYWNVIMNMAIFNLSPGLKEILNEKVINEINNNKNFRKFLLYDKDYKKYLFLQNLNILSEKELLIYKSKIEVNNRFIPFKILDLIQNGQDKYNDNIFMNHGDINMKYKSILERKMRENCNSKQRIAENHSKKKIGYFIELFYLSKLFPILNTEIKEYYYSISTNTSLWELLEYFYAKSNNNYKDAAFALELFYQKENKPEYLLADLSLINFKRSEEAFKIGKVFEAWSKSNETLDNIIKIQNMNGGLSRENFLIAQSAKKVLEGSGRDLIVGFANKGDIKTAKRIKIETIKKVNYIFKRSKYIKLKKKEKINLFNDKKLLKKISFQQKLELFPPI